MSTFQQLNFVETAGRVAPLASPRFPATPSAAPVFPSFPSNSQHLPYFSPRNSNTTSNYQLQSATSGPWCAFGGAPGLAVDEGNAIYVEWSHPVMNVVCVAFARSPGESSSGTEQVVFWTHLLCSPPLSSDYDLVLRNYRKQNMQTTARTLILDNVGIDVGFFQTKFTLGRSTSNSSVGSSILVGQFPSIAPTAFSGGQLTAAKNLDGVHVTINKQTYFVGASAPVLMGSAGYLRAANERYCATNDYAALLKGALWHISRHHKATRSLVIKNLVVGLPMTTIYDNSAFLEELCSGDHVLPSPVDTNEEIKISVKSVVVVAQPQGAIVNYKMTSPVGSVKDNDKVLVIDMGGGTFDWFVSLGDFTPIYKLCSATNVGTLNAASLVAGKIKSTFKSNHFILEDIDLALRTGADTFAIGNKYYAMKDYWPEVSGLVGGALSQMRNVVGEVEHIKHVVLSGGGAPLLQRVMREQMPDLAEQIKVDADPVYGNVRGFHHISEMIGD